MSIDPEDVAPLLAEVIRFARERVSAAASRPQAIIVAAELERLSSEAAELGLLSKPENGFGLWTRVGQLHEMAFNIGALREVAYANAGVAFAWHRSGLARHVAAALGLKQETNALAQTLTPTGHYGLARASLALWLRGAALAADDTALVTDWLDRERTAAVVIAPANWTTLLRPTWRDGAVEWAAARREELDVGLASAQHGFDELAAFLVRGSKNAAATAPADSRGLYARVLKMDMIGLLAIGAGALSRGCELARGYASVRRQGGKLIRAHAAVQEMLSDIEGALAGADIALRFCEQPLDRLDLGTIAAIRRTTHEQLRHAANQAVQVFGGYGYMRDIGAEKIVRDMNMLSLQTGGTRELGLFIAGWRGDEE
jgi:acyl-CoA dehydrogenase